MNVQAYRKAHEEQEIPLSPAKFQKLLLTEKVLFACGLTWDTVTPSDWEMVYTLMDTSSPQRVHLIHLAISSFYDWWMQEGVIDSPARYYRGVRENEICAKTITRQCVRDLEALFALADSAQASLRRISSSGKDFNKILMGLCYYGYSYEEMASLKSSDIFVDQDSIETLPNCLLHNASDTFLYFLRQYASCDGRFFLVDMNAGTSCETKAVSSVISLRARMDKAIRNINKSFDMSISATTIHLSYCYNMAYDYWKKNRLPWTIRSNTPEMEMFLEFIGRRGNNRASLKQGEFSRFKSFVVYVCGDESAK